MRTFAQNPTDTQHEPSRESTMPVRGRGAGASVVRKVPGTTTAPVVGFRHTCTAVAALGVLQPKLIVNQPDDEFEREADRVADLVVRGTAGAAASDAQPPAIQRKCRECEKEDDEAEAGEGGSAMRQAIAIGPGEEEDPFTQPMVLRKVDVGASGAATTDPSVLDLLRQESSGEPMGAEARREMEGAIGYDFSRVRIHRGDRAERLNRRLGALAFTHGRDVYFAAGTYEPHGSAGKRLLAHELTHVVQQGCAPRTRGSGSSRPVQTGSGPTPAIQRFAIWRTGPVNETRNLAREIVTGGAAGITIPVLNGANILSTAQSRAAILRPTLDVSADPAGGFIARVASTPTNTGSFDETVLAPGPWRTTVAKATIGTLLPALTACTGAGNSDFRAIGDPSDTAMQQANRRHEDRHASDHEVAFNGSLVPWDSNLIVAEVLREEFRGATGAAAEAALWSRMGGTPDDVADEYINEAFRLGNAFHATAAGGPVGAPTNETSSADCSTSSAKFTNPS